MLKVEGYEEFPDLTKEERERLERSMEDMIQKRQIANDHCIRMDKHTDPDWSWGAEVIAYDHDIWVIEKALEWNISEENAYLALLMDLREKE